jgi:hypothetical protein
MDEGTSEKVKEAKLKWDETSAHSQHVLLNIEGRLQQMRLLSARNPFGKSQLGSVLDWITPVMRTEVDMLSGINELWKLIRALSDRIEAQQIELEKSAVAFGLLKELLQHYKPVLDELEKDYQHRLNSVRTS